MLWIASGAAGLLYLPFYALATLPGLPAGFVIFGRRHAAGWIGGALIGYGLTQLALWIAIAAGSASGAIAILAWVAVCVTAYLLARIAGPGPAIEMPEWTAGDTRALLLVLLLVPAIMGPPYRNLGRADHTGTRYYRAYFTADFVWHAALAYELGKFTLPPRNPYMAPRAMNYYWTYFLLPATTAETAPIGLLRDVEACLKANAVLSGVLMIGALFLLVRTAAGRPGPAAVAVSLAMLAASAEGIYEIRTLLATGRPLSALLDTNIDAITAWRFGGLRIDNIPRSLWYTPQHTTSIALGLTGLLVAALGGARARLAAIGGAGLALGLATMLNPLLGAVCAALYGICVSLDALRYSHGWTMVPRHLLAAVPVVLAIAAGAASRVTEGAGAALDVGFSGFSRNHPVTTLLLSLGPVLVPALAGLIRCRADRKPLTIGVSGMLIGLFLLYFVRISEASWVGFRAGQILLVSIPILLACLFSHLKTGPAVLLAAAILAIGLPTTLVDTWNAQDISNRRGQGSEFRWTIVVTPAQQEAFRWLRANTPEDAIVQMEPMLRGREHWTLIPSFAGRRMAAGLPISLLPLPEYQERSERVRTLFSTPNIVEASEIARRLRLDYLYVDRDDDAAYPGVRKFDAHPERFTRVFANDEVRIYKVM